MKDLGVGVVGLGRLGYVHAVNATKLSSARLVAVCDMDEELARATSAELGCAYYTDIRKMLEDPGIDAVCVVTPTAYHLDPVTAVAESGKPFFLEKPLAASMEKSREIARIIEKAGIKCQIGFQRRFDPAHADAKQMIDDGVIGRPVYISAFARDPFPPPPWAMDPSKGGGLYIDMLLHDFDIARFFMGDEVALVNADETNLVVDGEGVNRFADNVIVNLRFDGGALATYHASMHAEYGYDIRTEVFGARGNLIVGGLHRTEVTLCSKEKGITHPQTFQQQGRLPHFMVRFREAYEIELREFVQAVIDDTPVKADVKDAMQAFKIALAATEAGAESRGIRPEDY
jgi:scyllo-inositol 2-dehydrogenase (NAD+)